MVLKLMVGNAILTFISLYAPQANLPEAEKVHFYDQLQAICMKILSTEVAIFLGDWKAELVKVVTSIQLWYFKVLRLTI